MFGRDVLSGVSILSLLVAGSLRFGRDDDGLGRNDDGLGRDDGRAAGRAQRHPVIGATCMNCLKIYKIVFVCFVVSAYVGTDKSFLEIFFILCRRTSGFRRKILSSKS